MEFRPSKCQVTQVHRWNHPIPGQYNLHRVILVSVSSSKYIGVDISNNLSLDVHINRSTKTASQILGFLRKNINAKYELLKSMVYNTLVKPQLENGSEICRSIRKHWKCPEKNSPFCRTSSVTVMLQYLTLHILDLRRINNRLSFMHKIHNYLDASHIENYRVPSPTPHTTAIPYAIG